MDQNNVRSSRPRTLDSVGGAVARPGRSVGSAHVIDLREKTSSFSSPSVNPSKPVVKKKPLRRQQPAAAVMVPAATPPAESPTLTPAAAAPASKPMPVRAPKQAPSPSSYTDAAFGDKPRFWPAFWRFLFLLILLGLIIALGVYIYFSYYQQG